MDAPDNRYILVSSWDQIREIDAAPDNVLSLQAAAREVLQPKHTMVGFEWHDKKGFDGAPLLRTIRYLLTAHLPHILPDIRSSISNMFDQRYEIHPVVKGEFLSTLPSALKNANILVREEGISRVSDDYWSGCTV